MIQLKELREERGWSQRQTAAKAGLKPTTYHNYEKGVREPDSEMLKRFADLFGVSIDRVVGREAPTDEEDEYWEELQILRDSPETRALLKATKGMTAQDVRAMADFAKALRKGKENDD